MAAGQTSKLLFVALLLPGLLSAAGAHADDAEAAVLAVADQALERISAEDVIGLTDLMVEESVSYAPLPADGQYRLLVRSWQESRENPIDVKLNERGFDPVVLVSGPVGMVWYPYDLYVDGQWSHCGVDIFTMVMTDDGWRIVSLTWSAEQPPQCQAHPDGPPQEP